MSTTYLCVCNTDRIIVWLSLRDLFEGISRFTSIKVAEQINVFEFVIAIGL